MEMNVSRPLYVFPASDDFNNINKYTDNIKAICIGVFLLPELTTLK